MPSGKRTDSAPQHQVVLGPGIPSAVSYLLLLTGNAVLVVERVVCTCNI